MEHLKPVYTYSQVACSQTLEALGLDSSNASTGLVVLIALLPVFLLLKLHDSALKGNIWGRRTNQPSKVRGSTATEYKHQFPPSRREAIISERDPKSTEFQKLLRSPDPTDSVFRSNQLPSTTTQDLEKSGQYTPTGFSTTDIKALGSFPDYSVLSGVPHPRPCPDFNIKTADFRPFRPFRWSYHQTMCKFIIPHWIKVKAYAVQSPNEI